MSKRYPQRYMKYPIARKHKSCVGNGVMHSSCELFILLLVEESVEQDTNNVVCKV